MRSTTDLEDMVRWLAGRGETQGGQDEGRANSAWATSAETNQFLEQIRLKTRTFFDEDRFSASVSADPPQSLPLPPARPTRGLIQIRSPRVYHVTLICGFLIAICFVSGWLIDRSISERLQSQTKILRTETSEGFKKLAWQVVQAQILPAENLDRIAWERVEATLASIEARLVAMPPTQILNPGPLPSDGKRSRAEQPGSSTVAGVNSETNSITILTDLATLHRELASSEAATTRQIQEMRTVLHELNAVVRRVLNRPAAAPATNVALPLLAIAVQALINNLQHQSTQVRGEAVEQLVRLGPLARSALPALQQMLARESDPSIRTAVETAISVIASN